MVMPATFQDGSGWEDSSGPLNPIEVQESDCWPVDDRSGSGTKDQLDRGLHPIVAVGNRAAVGRPLQPTGVVVDINRTVLGTATDRVTLNIADGDVVYQYVANVLTYNAGAPATFEQAPYVGQPVYIDDSGDLAEGVTCSLSPLNETGLSNPLCGHLHYCEDEIADGQAGGARATATFDTVLANSLVQQEYCVKLTTAKSQP